MENAPFYIYFYINPIQKHQIQVSQISKEL